MEKVILDEVKVERDDNRRNMRVGCAVVGLGILAIPVVIIAIPLVAALYRWAFG